MFAPRYTVWHCGTLKKGRKEMSNTPKTDALFFPFGRDATAAAEPSLLVCMTQYELLERENAALRLDAERYRWLRDNWLTGGFHGVKFDTAIDTAMEEKRK